MGLIIALNTAQIKTTGTEYRKSIVISSHEEENWLKTFAVFNPTAGRGRAGKSWKELEQKLETVHGPITPCFSKYPGHATILTRQALEEGADQIIAVGGDGT